MKEVILKSMDKGTKDKYVREGGVSSIKRQQILFEINLCSPYLFLEHITECGGYRFSKWKHNERDT